MKRLTEEDAARTSGKGVEGRNGLNRATFSLTVGDKKNVDGRKRDKGKGRLSMLRGGVRGRRKGKTHCIYGSNWCRSGTKRMCVSNFIFPPQRLIREGLGGRTE